MLHQKSKKKKLLATAWLVDEDEDELDYEGVAVATASTPPVTAPVEVPFGAFEPRAFTVAKYFAKVLFPVVGTLIAPTIPRPQ